MPLALWALTLSAFAIGTTEFVIVGLIPTIAASLGVSVPSAGLLVTEGFTTVEEVAFVDLDDLTSIQGFDEAIAAELQQRARFVSGAEKNGIPPEQSGAIFDLVDKFAGYGFNKSHAAAYAVVSYQTAWLKANAPVEFFAASMSLDIANTDKLSVFYQDAKRFGV